MEAKTMIYRPCKISEISIRNGMKEWVESRQSICEDPRIYYELPREIRCVLDMWIDDSIWPSRRVRARRSSYGLKADFQRDTGIYIYTGVFNGAMLEAGYQPVNSKDTNWNFKINVINRGWSNRRHP
jgi:hypothetical protein